MLLGRAGRPALLSWLSGSPPELPSFIERLESGVEQSEMVHHMEHAHTHS